MQEQIEELETEIRSYEVALVALDAEVGTVEAETHPEFIRRCKRLQQAKEQRVQRAKRAYDASIATLEKLHDLEMVGGSCLPTTPPIKSFDSFCLDRPLR